MIVTALRRAIGSEWAKLSWRSSLWLVVVPLAIGIPTLLNYGIAKAADLNKINGGGGMDTNNAAYWIIVFSTFILMAGGVTSLCAEFRDRTIDVVYGIAPRRWTLPVAKVVVFGTVSALTVAVTTFGILWGFPYLFPDVWGRVDLFSAGGLRLWIGVPVLTLLVTALGIGLSALIPRPSMVITLVLLWKFGLETFVTFIQGDFGLVLQRYSPFRNAELGVGQLATFDSPFGGANGSLLYFAAICLVIFGLGLWRMTVADPRND